MVSRKDQQVGVPFVQPELVGLGGQVFDIEGGAAGGRGRGGRLQQALAGAQAA